MGANQNIISNLSKDKYTIKAQSTTTISFNGANPNYFKITNGGATPLYLGTSMMPTSDFFDEKIAPASSKLHVDAYGKEQIYIYNPSTTDTNIIITSFSSNFDPTVLAMSGLGQDFSEIDFSGEVVVKGFTQGLPKGNNLIGKIELNGVDMSKVNQFFESTNNKNMCAVYSKDMTISSSSIFTSYCDDNRIVSSVDFLSNDGEHDIDLGICNILDNPDEYWTTITIKSGEVINNLTVYASAIKMTCNNTSGSKVRLVFREGVK